MRIDDFLSHLDKVRKSGRDQWMACCPAHDDRGPSLSIKQGDDGRILVYCFAGCPAESIVSSLRLNMTDLFVDSIKPAAKRQYSRTKLEQALFHELLILSINLTRRFDFKQIPYDDYVRERLAAQRVCKIVRELYV